MITSKQLFNVLREHNLRFLTGVPCSTYKDFLIYVNSHENEITHIRAASEGEAMGIAAGYYLATRMIPVIYMQNSGLGNAINPLTSLMDKEVYSMPALLFVSWRAEPGHKDEPQHKKMGRIMCDLLDTIEIPYEIAQEDLAYFNEQVERLKSKTFHENRPVALIFKEGTIVKEQTSQVEESYMQREAVLEILLEKIGRNIVVSTTGKTSREIFEVRERKRQGHQYDFLTVGSMGCASSIALGIALHNRKNVYLIDGDGAVLMKMGTLATIGHYAPKNLLHIVINNGVHESTGGQPTVSSTIDWEALFQSVGYQNVRSVKDKEALMRIDFSRIDKPAALIVQVSPGSREDLGRPTISPSKNKEAFMKYINP